MAAPVVAAAAATPAGIGIFTGLAIASGVGRIAGTILGRRRQRRFLETAEGQLAQREAQQGAISPAGQRQIVGEVASATGAVAQVERARVRGRLAARGLESSEVGARALAVSGTQQQEAVAQAGERVSLLNEQTRIEARRRLAAGITRTEETRATEEAGFRRDLIGVATQAVAGIIEGRAIDTEQARAVEQLASADQLQRLRVLLSVQLAEGAGAVLTPEIRALLNEILGNIRQPA